MKNGENGFFPFTREITRTLVKTYGRPTLGNKRNPFDELLFIILSSKTPPSRYTITYKALKTKYPSPDNLVRARPSAVAHTIEVGGLADKKARQILSVAKTLKNKFGCVTLNPLKRMKNQEAELFLDSLSGIGRKMARCILMYSLDRKVFPVDAHCFRISQRLGWVSKNTNLTDRVADKLQEGIPAHLRHDLHVGMILLGRDFCKAQKTFCKECPVKKHCSTGRRRI